MQSFNNSTLLTTGGHDVTLNVRQGLPRFVEMSLALFGLLLVMPLLFLAGILIIVTTGTNPLFKQRRVGRSGRQFVLYKLCTMRPTRQNLRITADDDRRITPIGRLLRKSKFDELPELWNVFKGDMSFVGPRPEVPRYVDLQAKLWQQTLQARPGLTDPVTLRLRNEEALLSKVNSDEREIFYLQTLQPAKLRGYVSYLQQRSWQSDLRVLWRTFIAIVRPASVAPLQIEEIARLYE